MQDADRIATSVLIGWATSTPSPDCEAFVKAWEGCELGPYPDGAGYWTIGYGHKMQDTDPHVAITQDEADSLFVMDIDMTAQAVTRLITMPLRQYQFDALCSFSFNLGSGALAMSTMRKLINTGDVIRAAEEFTRWDEVAGKHSDGVLKRRIAERAMFTSAVYSGRP